MAFDYDKYMRPGRLPHIWCPGCGYGIIAKSMLRAIDSLGWNKDDVVIASGIGCASRLPGYLDFNTLHTTHGRSLSFATGVKLAKPHLRVIALGGDGDMASIGGNHFIHTCRRNIDITVIVFNNFIYGMTGGQYSPTTPLGSKASTAPYGMIEPSFDISNLAIAAGASFVARSSSYHAIQVERIVKQALEHKGLSVVEVMSGCHTGYGRKNHLKEPTEMLNWQKENAVPIDKAKAMQASELEGKFTTGVLHDDKTKAEFVETYDRIVGFKASV